MIPRRKKPTIRPFQNSFTTLNDTTHEKKLKEMDDAYASFYMPNAAAHDAVRRQLQTHLHEMRELPVTSKAAQQSYDNGRLKAKGKFMTAKTQKQSKTSYINGALVPVNWANNSRTTPRAPPVVKGGSKDMWSSVKNSLSAGADPVGGAWYDFLDPNKNGVANAFDPNKNGVANAFRDAGDKISNEFTNPNSVLRGKILPEVQQGLEAAAPVLNFIPGVGEVADAALAASSAANAANEVATAAQTNGEQGGGRGKPKRALHPNMVARNALVKQIMATHHVSLPEASRMVKARQTSSSSCSSNSPSRIRALGGRTAEPARFFRSAYTRENPHVNLLPLR